MILRRSLVCHARFYELASMGPVYGVVSPDFVPAEGNLLHGGDLLAYAHGISAREVSRDVRARQHGLRRVLDLLHRLSAGGLGLPPGFVPFAGVSTPLHVFIGYLVFDAWIANQDRHGENWGVVLMPSQRQTYLAPAFDHGAAMGRSLLDRERHERMRTRDRGRDVAAFCGRARSGFYPNDADERSRTKPMTEVCAVASAYAPDAMRAWLGRLCAIESAQIDATIERMPADVMTPIARAFTAQLLKVNRTRLLETQMGDV